MNDYSIPKIEVAVEVRLPGMAPRAVRLHLAERAERHFGPERVSDLLEGEKRFLPVTSNDGTGFLRREALLEISLPGELEVEKGARTECVEVFLEDGSCLRGRVSYLLPRERGRLQDFLNSAERFVALHVGERIHYVNKSRIAWVHFASAEAGEDADH